MYSKMKVILISAKAQHGKDYCANIFKEELEKTGKKVLITHYADLLKYICKAFFAWDGNKDQKGREILQKVGTDKIRKLNENYWVTFIKTILTMFQDEWDYVLIPDTRFPNEIVQMNSNFWDTYSIRINRPNFKSNLTDQQKTHESEIALDNYNKFDFYIENNKNVKDHIINIINKIENPQKIPLFIDFDGTAYNTIEAICRLYDKDFNHYSDYKKIKWEDIETWDFTELSAATPEYINHYFNQDRFFEIITPFKNFYHVIDKLSNKYDIKIVSHGFSPNLRAKKIFIEEELPCVEFIGVNLKYHKDKSMVDMSGGIFIDDKSSNLETSNADIKICFGKEYEWNKEFKTDGHNYRCETWDEVLNVISGLSR